jgi:hypothetical protein
MGGNVKKFISLFTMIAFIIFSLSCYSTKSMRLDVDAAKENGKIKILQVVTKSGEIIEFSKEQPGKIYNDSITGKAVRVIGELDKAYIKRKEVDKKGEILRMMVSIPLSEVEMIGVKKIDIDKTFLALLGTAAVAGILLWIVLAIGMSQATIL